MRVTVRYFAALREARGVSEETVELPAGATAADVRLRLAPPGMRVAVAVGEALVPDAHVLREGDAVALLPPLGGG
jgi:molybdopterin synthase sulfur carrier subunit